MKLFDSYSEHSPTIIIVGCGGTGGFVAEGVCRLLSGRRGDSCLLLMDPDLVEARNLLRQNFYPQDVGHFKAQVLAERLSRQFGRVVGYSCEAVTDAPRNLPLSYRGSLVVGCVDNGGARAAIARHFEGDSFYYASPKKPSLWWVDAGNGDTFGQVLIGNSARKSLKHAFNMPDDVCYRLPLPTLQMPGILLDAPVPAPAPDCAQAVEQGGQDPVINQMMAAVVCTVVERLLAGTCAWMRLSVDMRRGYVQAQDATPENVARLTQLSMFHLTGISPKKKKGGDKRGRRKPRNPARRRRAAHHQPATHGAWSGARPRPSIRRPSGTSRLERWEGSRGGLGG